MSDLDQIEDIIQYSTELTYDQKGPLKWAVKKAREKVEVITRFSGFNNDFATDDSTIKETGETGEIDPFEDEL